MPLVKAQCPNCMGNLDVDNTKDAAICPFCGTPFIVEKAIHNITNYINNSNYIQNAIFTNESRKESPNELWNKALKYIYYDEFEKASEAFDVMLTEYIDDSRPVEYLIENSLYKFDPSTGRHIYFYYSKLIHDFNRSDFILNRYYIMFPDRRRVVHERLYESFKNGTLEENGFINFFKELMGEDNYPIYSVLRTNAQYVNAIISEKSKSLGGEVYSVFIVQFSKIIYGKINTVNTWELGSLFEFGNCKGIFGQYLIHNRNTYCQIKKLACPIYTKRDVDIIVKDAEKRTIRFLKTNKKCIFCGKGKVGLFRVCDKCGKINHL